MQVKNNGKEESKQSEEKQRGQQLQYSFALLEHFLKSIFYMLYTISKLWKSRIQRFKPCTNLELKEGRYGLRKPTAPEATNKTLMFALKKRLEQTKEKWVEELPGVLWAYRTTPGRPIGNIPSPRIRVLRTTKYEEKIAVKNYKKKSSHWEGLPRSFSFSPGGIEGTSRFIPCSSYNNGSQRSTFRLPASGSPPQVPPFPQQTQPPTLLFALINATANPLSAFSQLTPLSGVASLLPSIGPSRPPPHAGGRLQIPPGSLP
ncbi:hypothetical protein CK203_053231 [Vitis vinifera]|uniref:Uncharacterized protein n=1 Tax=Vitis vinifera TaxID=29760 RepID=A0A438GK04_VITVI|nr:hypothetical protein CK203_053231 [Vitis vinifera]